MEITNPARLDALLGAAERGDPAAGRTFVGLITTNFTRFFRHPKHFGLATEQVFRAVRSRGRARLWSAGAATGEEPYSLAMALLQAFQPEQPPATILATDISEEALAVARRGEYSEAALDALTADQRRQFFGATGRRKPWALVPAVRQLVEFRAFNLMDGFWPIEGPFDVIFCRNVLMYLETGCRRTVLERMAFLLAPEGLLLLDPTEHPGPAGYWFSPIASGVYSLRRAPAGIPRP